MPYEKINWQSILGCFGRFGKNKKFYIVSIGKISKITNAHHLFPEYMVVKEDENNIYISNNPIMVVAVEKEKVIVI